MDITRLCFLLFTVSSFLIKNLILFFVRKQKENVFFFCELLHDLKQ